MRKPTRQDYGEGRHRWGSERSMHHDSAGVVAMACMKEEDSGNTGSPWRGCAHRQPALREELSRASGWRKARSSDDAG